jgi:hypothetical protein
MHARYPIAVSAVFALALTAGFGRFDVSPITPARQPAVARAHLPLAFEVNRGQFDPQVSFVTRGSGASVFVTPTEAVFSLRGDSHDAARTRSIVRMRFERANVEAEARGVDELAGRANYFQFANGRVAARYENVPTFSRVQVPEVYPGIDLVYYGNDRQLEYDLVVSPGADPGQIALDFNGADRLHIDHSGDLVVEAGGTEMRQHRPYVFQDIEGRRRSIDADYRLSAPRHVSFVLGAYDHTRPLILDPAISFVSYLGGTNGDVAEAVAVDGAGAIYLTGQTQSGDFPLTITPPVVNGDYDLFVTKINAAGTAVVYSVYLQASGFFNIGKDIKVDAAGDAYVTGQVGGCNFGLCVLVARFGPTGAIKYATGFGNGNDNRGDGIAIDGAGFAYVTGQVSSGFPATPGAFQTTAGSALDAFVAKVNTNLASGDFASLVYSTFLGGVLSDEGNKIAIDGSGNAYVTGSAGSGFPTSAGGFQKTFGGDLSDAFVAKLNPTGTTLLYSSFLGGDDYEVGNGIAVDSVGNVYIAGTSRGDTLPTTPGSFQPIWNAGDCRPPGSLSFKACTDGFVAKFNPSASGAASRVYSTYLGGTGDDQAYALAVDGAGNTYIAGSALSSDFPTVGPIPGTAFTGNGGFISELNPSGSALVFSSYFPAEASGLARDTSGNIYLAGGTFAASIATAGAYQTINKGAGDGFFAKVTGFNVPPPSCTYSIAPPSAVVPAAGGSGTVTLTTQPGCPWTATPSAAFISVTSGASGTGSGTVAYNVSALSGASRSGTINIGGQTFTINQSSSPGTLPTLALAPAAVNFGAVNNAGTLQFKTAAQTLTLTQAGSGTVTWTAAGNQPWITVTPTSGSGPATLTVSINNTSGTLPSSGSLSGIVTLSASGAANSPTASVNLTVLASSQLTAPTGSFDSPGNGQTGVTGSIAVTGWAIDDIGVTQVRVLRNPVPAEGTNQVFIGNAAFVNGARPDIAASYPTKPLKDQAGWGYILLTNFLPNQGNGTFTLYAYADDADGRTTLLGSKTITCTNASATAPFGAIDTPTQGGTASGAAFVNFGWALAAQKTGRSIPTNGSTIQVFVDSASIGALDGYNNARPDIQALFPGYVNTNGAVGFKTLNTTTMSNGVHTIAWVVTDNLGAAAGVGSRYFTVSNSTGAARTDDRSTSSHGAASVAAADSARIEHAAVIDVSPPRLGSAASLAAIPQSNFAIGVTHGYDGDAVPALAMPDTDGVRHARTAQLERVVLDLDPRGEGGVFRGYTIDGEALRALPVGSHLDAATGEFAWAPGLAVGGTYALLFVRERGGALDQIRVDVGVDAERAQNGEPRLVIDIPSAAATVHQPFTIAGWAIDPGGPANGSGIDALHVWAYPVAIGRLDHAAPHSDSGRPIWLGAAAYRGLRPDVGDLFGPRFAQSGFSIGIDSLSPGTYDIVVYAHSIATDQFAIARTVRVTVTR